MFQKCHGSKKSPRTMCAYVDDVCVTLHAPFFAPRVPGRLAGILSSPLPFRMRETQRHSADCLSSYLPPFCSALKQQLQFKDF